MFSNGFFPKITKSAHFPRSSVPRSLLTPRNSDELFVAAHVFSGSEQTLGGYYSRNDSVMVGWQAKF